jgi:RNA polymerase sigma-70 factor (ECF subfamily)
LLARYVVAFERYDIASLVSLLDEEVRFSMPPYPMWLNDPAEVHKWMLGPGAGCKGSRMLVTTANGCTAVGQYRVDPQGGHAPWALQVLEMSGGRIVAITNFLDTELFAAFGLPPRLDD